MVLGGTRRPTGRDRYLFRPGRGDGPPNDWESIFGGPAWTQVEDGTWYLHLFAPEQPDLNWDDLEVRAEFADVLRFWLDRGVDGFRIDVAHGMVKDPAFPDVGRTRQVELLTKEQLPYFDQDGVHEIYREWRKILDSYPGERIARGRGMGTGRRAARPLRPPRRAAPGVQLPLPRLPFEAEAMRRVIEESLVIPSPTWVLSNHDVQRHVTRYGSVRRARAAALLMLALPGSAYVYQGEELGLPEVRTCRTRRCEDPMWERSGRTERGRDGCRVPLPWSSSGPALGFASGEPWLPMPASWRALSVEVQDKDPGSMLALYRAALVLRRTIEGELRWLDAPDGVLAFARGDFVCAVNTGTAPVELPLDGELLLSSGAVQTHTSGSHLNHTMVPGEAAAWWRAGANALVN